MNLDKIKNNITDKWHECQTNLSIFQESQYPVNIPIKELPTEEGLYLCYIYDKNFTPKFHYEILEWKNELEFMGNFFSRIDADPLDKVIYVMFVIKWMKYNDFVSILEKN